MYLFIYFKDFIYLYFREGERREEERERNIDVREKHQSVASCTRPKGRLNQKARHVS